jgi:hypothetical protein
MAIQTQYFLKRQMQITLYSLKRQYGGPVVVYNLLESEVDMLTGDCEVETRATRINRAVILPGTMSRETMKDIASGQSIKQLIQGGGYDTTKRTFVIDKRDARNLTVKMEDYLVYEGCKYQFDKVEPLDFDAGWIISGKVLNGESDLEEGIEFIVKSDDELDPTDETGAVKGV